MKPTIGTCYYPEHWDEKIWRDDAARMRDAGIDWVRIGEFAWSRIEPKEGQLDWGWLDRAVNILSDANLKIIMGTPTATPPNWVIEKYPDMIAMDQNGQPRKFGSRRHYCFSHQGYKQQCANIVTLMAERYGKHPAVQAWQTDNEYGCHETTQSFGPSARDEFRNWLAQKYQSPDALNRAWGNIFWSMEYDDFNQIDVPNLTVTEPNPSHVMDFRRFSSDQVVAFNKLQADILRRYTDMPLVHNYMGKVTGFDHFDIGADLDIASWDSYPLGFLEMIIKANEEHKAEYYQQGDPDFQAFHHDLYRNVGNGRLWVMEQQPGPVNWAHFNPAPLNGMVRLWSLEAIAHGAESVNYFRWRQAPFAQEQMHAGLLRPDHRDAQGLIEAKQVKDDIEAFGDVTQIQAPVALIFDYPSQWASEVQPQGASFDYFQLLFNCYKSLRSMGVDVDIISGNGPKLEGYKLVLLPGLFTLDDDLKHSLNTFDGLVLAGPRFNSKTKDFQIPQNLAPDLDQLDITVSRVETLRSNVDRKLENGGKAINWVEEIETSEDVIEKTADGAPILIRKNNLLYLAAWLDDEALKLTFKRILSELDIETLELPTGVRLKRTRDHTFFFNYSKNEQVLDDIVLSAAGATWIEH
ncbi:beta-galactosidase [Lentilitoribacter sp. EG35]|uniref:beta-galactosidase n=1 Tax=Lentilitoribacter sp. EG35 TaxID=3234192 RepID=UPI0034600B06